MKSKYIIITIFMYMVFMFSSIYGLFFIHSQFGWYGLYLYVPAVVFSIPIFEYYNGVCIVYRGHDWNMRTDTYGITWKTCGRCAKIRTDVKF